MTDAAKKLLEEDRRWLAEMLTEHVPAPSQDEIDAAWRAEAIRRAEETERGDGQTVDGRSTIREIEPDTRS